MNIFIIYAHPEPQSYDNMLKETAIREFTRNGHSVQVSDLYEMRFKATMDPDDYTAASNQTPFNFLQEQLNASNTHTFTPDILAEQRKLLWADVIIFQFPLWWYSVPAILKGWFDRVLAYGFAYGQGRNLAGRRVMCVLTTGGPARPFTPEKRLAINDMLDHIQRHIFHFCGLAVLPPFVIYGAASSTLSQREQFTIQYIQRLRILDKIPILNFNET